MRSRIIARSGGRKSGVRGLDLMLLLERDSTFQMLSR